MVLAEASPGDSPPTDVSSKKNPSVAHPFRPPAPALSGGRRRATVPDPSDTRQAGADVPRGTFPATYHVMARRFHVEPSWTTSPIACRGGIPPILSMGILRGGSFEPRLVTAHRDPLPRSRGPYCCRGRGGGDTPLAGLRSARPVAWQYWRSART